MRKLFLLITFGVTTFVALPGCVRAQDEANTIPLGDLARSLRRGTSPAEANVIDNDNLSQVMDAVENKKSKSGLTFSFDGLGKTFKVSSPDVTCSLSFNAQMTSIISEPATARELPESQLERVDGAASIEDGVLQVTILNRSAWDLQELTEGLTVVRSAHNPQTVATYYGQAKLLPAAVSNLSDSAEKRSDSTVLYHLRGSSASLTTSVFRESLLAPPAPSQEWHWAIVQAKGVPSAQVAASQ